MAKCARVMVFDINGTPLKPFPLPEAKATCKKCGAPIRWAKDGTVGVRLAVDKDIYIVQVVESFNPEYRKYITAGGDVVSGRPHKRGFAGCRVAYRLHKCEESENEDRAEVRILPGKKPGKKRRK